MILADDESIKFDADTELSLTFELCSDKTICRDNLQDYLIGKNFRVPAANKIFDPLNWKRFAPSVIDGVREDIRYPFNPLLQIIYEVELEEILINKVSDELLSRVSKKIEEESYLVVGKSRKVIHPQSDNSTPF